MHTSVLNIRRYINKFMDTIYETLKWVLIIFAGLWILWFFTGGPERYENKYNPFVTPASPLDTNEIYRYKDGVRIIQDGE